MDRWEDEIVEEVRAMRDAYAQRFAYDVQAICRDLRQSQDEGNRKIVRLPAEQVAPMDDRQIRLREKYKGVAE